MSDFAKPTDAARVAADTLIQTRFADRAEKRNAIVRLLLEFYDAGRAINLTRIERLESLLRRCGLRLFDDHDMREEISRALDHEHT